MNNSNNWGSVRVLNSKFWYCCCCCFNVSCETECIWDINKLRFVVVFWFCTLTIFSTVLAASIILLPSKVVKVTRKYPSRLFWQGLVRIYDTHSIDGLRPKALFKYGGDFRAEKLSSQFRYVTARELFGNFKVRQNIWQNLVTIKKTPVVSGPWKAWGCCV